MLRNGSMRYIFTKFSGSSSGGRWFSYLKFSYLFTMIRIHCPLFGVVEMRVSAVDGEKRMRQRPAASVKRIAISMLACLKPHLDVNWPYNETKIKEITKIPLK